MWRLTTGLRCIWRSTSELENACMVCNCCTTVEQQLCICCIYYVDRAVAIHWGTKRQVPSRFQIACKNCITKQEFSGKWILKAFQLLPQFPHRGSAPGPRWGTLSVPRTPTLPLRFLHHWFWMTLKVSTATGTAGCMASFLATAELSCWRTGKRANSKLLQ